MGQQVRVELADIRRTEATGLGCRQTHWQQVQHTSRDVDILHPPSHQSRSAHHALADSMGAFTPRA